MLGPTKEKDTPRPRAKEKPKPDGRRGKIMFGIKLHTSQRGSEGSKKNYCTPGDPTETEPGLPLSVSVSPVEHGSALACHRGGSSRCLRPECGISPLGGDHH